MGSALRGFLKANCSLPSLAASASFSPSSGVTSTVITRTGRGLSSLPRLSSSVPEAKTRTFWSTVFVTAGDWDIVTRTSTMFPGLIKPATPTISSTFTAMARFAGFVIAATPPLVTSSGANLASMRGSFITTWAIKTRPSTRSMLGKDSGGTL